MNDYVDNRETIRQLQRAKGVSLRQLAKRVGASPATLSRLLKRQPNSTELLEQACIRELKAARKVSPQIDPWA